MSQKNTEVSGGGGGGGGAEVASSEGASSHLQQALSIPDGVDTAAKALALAAHYMLMKHAGFRCTGSVARDATGFSAPIQGMRILLGHGNASTEQ